MRVHVCVMVSFKPDSSDEPKRSLSAHDRPDQAREQLLAFAKEHISGLEQFSFKQVTEWLESGKIHFVGRDGSIVIGWIAETEAVSPVVFRETGWGEDQRRTRPAPEFS